MEPFQLSCKLLSLCGVWRPESCSTKLDTTLYQLYRLFVVPLPYLLNFGLLVRLFLEDLLTNELFETFFLYIITFGVCFKSYNCIRHQKDIIKVSTMLWSKHSAPQNEVELAIQSECYQFIRFLIVDS